MQALARIGVRTATHQTMGTQRGTGRWSPVGIPQGTHATWTAISLSGLRVMAWEVLGLWKFLEPTPLVRVQTLPSGPGLCVVEAGGYGAVLQPSLEAHTEQQ